MKHAFCAVAIATVVWVAPARAAGVNLSWNDCGAFGASSRTFACDTNIGLHVLVGSFVAPAGIEAMNGNEIVIDVMSACPVFPDWWIMRSFTCRGPTSLASSFDFTGGPGNCADYWQGGAIGGHVMDGPVGNYTQIRLQCALPVGDSRIGPIAEDTEVYSFKATINSARTVGPGSCAGCEAPMCLMLRSIRLTQASGLPHYLLSNPAQSAYAVWQSGSIGITPYGPVCFGDCPVPTRDRTWGQIKGLYR